MPPVGLEFFAVAALAQAALAPAAQVRWSDCLAQLPAWYAGAEAVRVADNLLLYQRASGGWPKNVDMAEALSKSDRAKLAREKPETDSTIDNGATHTQLRFLGRVHRAQPLSRHTQAFLVGIDYLLEAQYANGGWPQYYPLRRGYYTHITYNDDAMIEVLALLRDVARGEAPYAFVDAERRSRAERAVERGTECILKTQVMANGRLTVWCAQHDETTFAPARARTYEHASLSGYESVGIVRFLMQIDAPGERVRQAVQSAVEWFEQSRLADGRWARFYEIGTNRPIFSGRDGVIKYDVAEIEAERRDNYRWHVDNPARLLSKDFPEWREKWLAARGR